MLGSFSRSPLQAHTGDPNDHILVPPAQGTTLYSHRLTTTAGNQQTRGIDSMLF